MHNDYAIKQMCVTVTCAGIHALHGVNLEHALRIAACDVQLHRVTEAAWCTQHDFG